MKHVARVTALAALALGAFGLFACNDESVTGLYGDYVLALDHPFLAGVGVERFSVPEVDGHVPAKCRGTTRVVESEGFLRINWTCKLPGDPGVSPTRPIEGVLFPSGDDAYGGNLIVQTGSGTSPTDYEPVPAVLAPAP